MVKMILKRHKKFTKQFSRLSKKKQDSVNQAIFKFSSNPFDKTLYNHPLKGRRFGLRSISAESDLRILFRETDDYIEVLFVEVGSHGQLYDRIR